jgi:phage tail sheath protein FI
VVWFKNVADLNLKLFEPIDEIAIVAAPGRVDQEVQQAVVDHCVNMGDRFAILDTADLKPDEDPTVEKIIDKAQNSDYAAIYFPRIKVFDVATKRIDPNGDGQLVVAPSGHVAGIYARVDTTRGVHKAPANEVIRGALGVTYPVSKAVQDGLNPKGVNCIRDMNGNIRVWGGRTLGGDANLDYKYINVRRLMLFLRESIDEGTQWVVFEPNDRSLWAKIVRNVTAFLTNVWRDGALFGSTPAEAFYVKCDDETNPPEVRDLGRVITEIGVAPVRPAEFVIFRITQWAGPQGQ